jgi:uncharacterized PurR-regulated membrane protein YhhQ (DUF165 family)
MRQYSSFRTILIVIGAILITALNVAHAKTVKMGVPGYNVTQAAFFFAKERGY